MSDFRNPIERPEDLHPGWHRSHKIERDKQGREPADSSKSKADRSKSLALTLLALKLKETLSYFLSSRGSPATQFERETLNEELISLRNLFRNLEEKDLSRDFKFPEELQLLWHRINDHCNLISANSDKLKFNIESLNILISEINIYGKGEEFSLGEYLNKNAGIGWLPVPFLTLLQALHKDHQKNQLSSVLEEWIGHINEQLQ